MMNKSLIYQQRRIHYQVSGSGNPVMLVHGFGEDARVWRHQVSHLEGRFTCIVPDLPGSGLSELVPDMSMEGLAEVLHAIIHEEKLEACPVVGHSMGGYITLALAGKYWNHVSAFGLFHSSAFADSDEKKATREKGIAFTRQHGAFEFLKTTTPNLFSPETREKNPDLVKEQVASLHNFLDESVVSYYRAMMARPDRTAVLQQTTVPVLFIMGKYDGAVPLEDGLKQCHLPKKSYIHVLQRSGHMGMLEEKEKSNRILEEFLLET